MTNRKSSSFDNPSRLFLAVDALLIDPLMGPVYRGFVRSLVLDGNEDVLEVGCGTGRGSRHLAAALENGGRLTCMDNSTAQCREARRRLRSWQNTEVAVGDITKLALPPESQDVVVIHFMLHDVETEARADALQALSQVLKPAGLFHIREPTKASHGIPVEEIRLLMKGAGLTERRGREHRLGVFGRVYSGVYEKEYRPLIHK